MASRVLTPRMALLSRSAAISRIPARSFQTSRVLLQEVVAAAPVKKPVGAFRGGLLGFLLGSTLAGASTYYYILEEYRVSNDLLTDDIYQLHAAVQRVYEHLNQVEAKLAQTESKK